MAKLRRYFIFSTAFGVCIGAAWVVVAVLPPNAGVTQANFDRIKDDATLDEVESIFGKENAVRSTHTIEANGDPTCQWRHADGAFAHIQFQNGKVCHKVFVPSIETFHERFCRWLNPSK